MHVRVQSARRESVMIFRAALVLAMFAPSAVAVSVAARSGRATGSPKRVYLCDGKVTPGRCGSVGRKLLSCSDMEDLNKPESEGGTVDNANLAKAMEPFCEKPEFENQVEVHLSPRFEKNYERLTGKDGWIDEAYIAFFGIKTPGARSNLRQQMTWLIKSVHQNSDKPIIAFDFGDYGGAWTPEEFPNLIVLHAFPMADSARGMGDRRGDCAGTATCAFFFNKFRAMMLAKVRNGITLDADQFVAPAGDRLFKRIKEEITEEYPYPIMPVHWLSRDPDTDYWHNYKQYDFKCKGCPKRTMRFAHAHPTFSHWALPFIGKWLRKTMDNDMVGQTSLGSLTDEEVLNVALWSEGATKQWCKFDVPFETEFFKYFKSEKKIFTFKDDKWFPKGVPIAFYTAHHPINFEQTEKIMETFKNSTKKKHHLSSFIELSQDITNNEAMKVEPLEKEGSVPVADSDVLDMLQEVKRFYKRQPTSFIEKKSQSEAPVSSMDVALAGALPPPIFHFGKYYDSYAHLKRDHPDLKCML